MEQFHHLVASGSSKASTTIPFCLAHTSTSSPVAAPDSSRQQPNHGSGGASEEAVIKAKIMSHPLYPSLLRAFVDCRKVGAPLDVAGRLSSITDEVDSRSDDLPAAEQPADPELDQFMETYRYMLARYGQELARPIQEANDFFRSMEAQIALLALDHADDNSCVGDGSSEDEQEAGRDMAAAGSPENAAGNAELKSQLLHKRSDRLSSIWRELSKRKKKEHLPWDAREKLLQWWHLHYGWPYPSEMEKAALAEATGLDAKQISNWFINQRKRYWKPTPTSPPMAPPAMDFYGRPPLHPQYGAASSSSSSAAAFWRQGGAGSFQNI